MAMHSAFRPVVEVCDCFIILLVYDFVPVSEICESIFQGRLLPCHKSWVSCLVFKDASVGHVYCCLVGRVVVLGQLAFHVVNVLVVVDGLEYLPVVVWPHHGLWMSVLNS
jgi:hypothetical protein